MLKCGRANFTACHLLGAAFLCLASVGTVAALAGVRVNTSYSLPLGLYVRTGNPDATLVEFCPLEPYAHESSVRGYRTRGTACKDGAVPLLKPVVAVPGDRVVLSNDGIAVNGRLLPQTAPLARDAKGRPLRAWPLGTYFVNAGTVWVASTYNRGSYDSRYMGPISVRQIRARLRPLWLL
jgi:conjugative transfer signal peptidase TraF